MSDHPGSNPSCAEEAHTSAEPSAWRCETCKHWKFEEPDWEFDELKFGECKAIRQREAIEELAFGGDREKRWTDEGEKIMRDAIAAAKAIAVDGSGYYAAVRTAPDFGCVLHVIADGTEAATPASQSPGTNQ